MKEQSNSIFRLPADKFRPAAIERLTQLAGKSLDTSLSSANLDEIIRIYTMLQFDAIEEKKTNEAEKYNISLKYYYRKLENY